MSLLLPLALLAQFGTQVPMGSAAPVAIAPLPIPRRSSVVKAAPPEERQASPENDRLAACLAKTRSDPQRGVIEARDWLSDGGGPMAQVRANQCLGMALSDLGQFGQAERAFADAIAGIPAEQAVAAVPLMAMAGNAALAAGETQPALDWFDKALAVPANPDKAMLGGIEADRARALVAAGRPVDAGGALAQARTLAPDYAEAWLLSATLARRQGDLAQAQGYIERAAALDPRDPATGLEAGVIAVLSGRDEAARRSWQSVLALAPGSKEAQTAQGYIDQLGPAKAPEPAKEQQAHP
ncbi:MAG: tetratricopeptide repeat protein [Sphingomonadales bacterium]|nr:tetratricopeptide repeat protein [Sphingomonadales bacterium]MDE2567814.1 tetratricopeptide repeat protein [Sphingomonadales bacterium]